MSVITTEWRPATKKLPARIVARWMGYTHTRPTESGHPDEHAIAARQLADKYYQTPSDWYCAGGQLMSPHPRGRYWFVTDTRLAFRCVGTSRRPENAK